MFEAQGEKNDQTSHRQHAEISHETAGGKRGCEELRKIYEKEYDGEYFIKLMDEGEIPHLSSVRGSNFAHIGGFEIDETGRVIMLSAIDNLVKGASGQAIHNMNIMLGLKESVGLEFYGLHP